MAVWGRVAYGPNGARGRVRQPCWLGGGGGASGLAGGGKGPAPPWSAFSIPRVEGGGQRGSGGGSRRRFWPPPSGLLAWSPGGSGGVA